MSFCLFLLVNNYVWLHQINNGDIYMASSAGANDQKSVDANGNIQLIREKNLFGSPTPAQLTPVVKELPKTTLNLTLRGVAVSTTDQQSNAMIEGPDGSIHNYLNGDTLPGNATLTLINKDSVVLNREGSLETLTFPPLKTSKSAVSASVQAGTNNLLTGTSPNQPVQTQTRPARETPQARDARLSSQLQQQNNKRNQLSLEERLNTLRQKAEQQ